MSVRDDSELTKLFLEETEEHLETIEADLMILENSGSEGNADTINRLFRAVHSIKGSAGFLSWDRLKSLAHAMEGTLNLMRSGKLSPSPGIITTLLEASDSLKQFLQNPEDHESIEVDGIIEALSLITRESSGGDDAAEIIVTKSKKGVPKGSVDSKESKQSQKLRRGNTPEGVESRQSRVQETQSAPQAPETPVVPSPSAPLDSMVATAGSSSDTSGTDESHPVGQRPAASRPAEKQSAAPVRTPEPARTSPPPPAPAPRPGADAADDINEEVMKLFLEETQEHLDNFEKDILTLENSAMNPEVINRMFRAIHTIKGSSGFIGWTWVKNLAHEMETLLNMMRSGGLEADASVSNLLLECGDMIRQMVDNPGENSETDTSSYVDRLRAIIGGSQKPGEDEQTGSQEPRSGSSGSPHGGKADKGEAGSGSTGSPPSGQGKKAGAAGPEAGSDSAGFQSSVKMTGPSGLGQKKTQENPHLQGMATESLRVNVKVLDTLMTLAGELVLTRNQLLQMVSTWDKKGIEISSQRLNLVTSELQEAIMSTRMQPIGKVFNKFIRIVRDLALSLGKEIGLVIEGEEVELDKAIIEAIGDPLTHLVRNAVDHGIESNEERFRTSKPAAGTIKLAAKHEAGHVIIEVSDDGSGINPSRIKDKAAHLGLFDRYRLDAMSNKELLNIIFHPGFSLASNVTDLSGRGVGMDVVLSNVSKLGGSIEIDSAIGAGTRFNIKLPLTLTIIPSLIVSTQGERYAIPQTSILELVRIQADQIQSRIERIGEATVVRIRGKLLPIVGLPEILGIQTKTFIHPVTGQIMSERRQRIEDIRLASPLIQHPMESQVPADSIEGDELRDDSDFTEENRQNPASSLNIVIVNTGNLNYGIVVDKLLDSEEIVVKPLGTHLKNCDIYAGATIQGDGKVALILDIGGIRRTMNLGAAEESREKSQISASASDRGNSAQSLLVAKNGANEFFAIPLGLVSRIEKIARNRIEIHGGKKGMKYRKGFLPLISIEDVVKVDPINSEKKNLFVAVFKFRSKEVGILISEIIDVIDCDATIDDLTHKQTGILGSAIINGETTMLLDPFTVVRAAMPELDPPERQQAEVQKVMQANNRILVVDDSQFFLDQISGFLEEEGFEIVKACDGIEALETLDRLRGTISMVVTDIEMPRMNGIELTERMKASKIHCDIPVIAVTSIAGEAAEKRGYKAGIDEYLVKLDREKIITAVRRRSATVGGGAS